MNATKPAPAPAAVNAVVVAVMVHVQCPRCSEPVESPTGSFDWELGQLKGSHTCPSCETTLRVSARRITAR